MFLLMKIIGPILLTFNVFIDEKVFLICLQSSLSTEGTKLGIMLQFPGPDPSQLQSYSA